MIEVCLKSLSTVLNQRAKDCSFFMTGVKTGSGLRVFIAFEWVVSLSGYLMIDPLVEAVTFVSLVVVPVESTEPFPI